MRATAHRPGGGGGVDREAAIELLAQLALDGVDVRRGDELQGAELVEDAHRAPIGDVRDGDVGDRPQRPRVVQGLVEQPAGAREEVGPGARLALGLQGPLALGDVEDHATHAEQVAAGAVNRRAGDVEVPHAVRRGGARAAELEVVERQARVEDAPVQLHELGGRLAQDLRDRPPDVVLDRAAVEGRHRLVDADEAQVGVDEGQPDRGGREDGVEEAERALGGVVQAGVVDRERAAGGEGLGEGQVLLGVVAAVPGRQERQRPDAAPPREHRNEHVGPRRQPLEDAALLGVEVRGRRPTHVVGEDGLGGARDPAGLGGAVDLPAATADPDERRLELGVGVPAGDLLLDAGLVGEEDGAPVRELGDGELGDAAERLPVVERARQHLPGVGEEPQRLARRQDRVTGLEVVVGHARACGESTVGRGGKGPSRRAAFSPRPPAVRVLLRRSRPRLQRGRLRALPAHDLVGQRAERRADQGTGEVDPEVVPLA